MEKTRCTLRSWLDARLNGHVTSRSGGSATLTHPPGARLSSRCLIGRRFQDAGSSYVVEKVSPGPYLELFGRTPRPGWSVWGSDSTCEPRKPIFSGIWEPFGALSA